MQPEIGQIVRVRSRQYLVEDISRAPLPLADKVHQRSDTLMTLSCLEDDAQGEPLQVLWEREIDAKILGRSSWKQASQRGFDEPSLFSAYLHTLRWNCVTSTDPKLFQAPYRAGIEVMAYQLEPLRKALLMPRVNLFIADDVGLGKTIEAGLILREMLMRQKVRQIVICCPPSVTLQWQEEMEQRFGLTFVVVDRAFITRIRRERGYGINPWTTHTRFIISQALIRDEAYAGPLRTWLGTFSPSSMLILDEAHNAAPASSARYAIDSKLTRIIREMAPRFEHRLFLSATPHNGHSNSFAALLEILDPQRFCRGVPVSSAKQLDAVMVRRLKGDLRALGSAFPKREVLRIEIHGDPKSEPSLRLSSLLQQYREAREERLAYASQAQRNSALLVLTSLQKRLLSSIEAFERTLRVHKGAIFRQLEKNVPEAQNLRQGLGDLSLLFESPDADDERAELDEEDVQAEEEAQMVSATTADPNAPTQRELDLLGEMSQIALQQRYQPDGRIRFLVDWLRENLCQGIAQEGKAADPDRPWAAKRVLIFTEYTDTKRYLQNQLASALEGTHLAELRVDTFHGGMGDERREEIKRAFNTAPEKHPLRILIATDAAREGVNLQNYCADLFHFDIPWNPSRMEQRNGRIDRKLQRASAVRCHYFVYPERAEDRVLEALVRKTKTIREELGSLSPVLERELDKTLREGIRHKDVASLTQKLESIEQSDASLSLGVQTIKRELEESREVDKKLLKQLDELRDILKKSQDWLALDERHFRDALSASLKLLGALPLEQKTTTTEAWLIPTPEKLQHADPTWINTLDTLRKPRKRGQDRWAWRKESPILPVIFRDAGQLDGESIHLHLEHRLVQRLLGRFLAQGFVHDDLSRACVCFSDDPSPKVILLGRLSLYGDRAARLHDEIIAAVAEWNPLEQRGSKKLRALGESAKEDILRLLDTSLATPRLREVPETVRKQYLRSISIDVEQLAEPLQKRAEILAERAAKKLSERGEKEAAEMVTILQDQEKRIQKMLSDDQIEEQKQLFLGFVEEEKKQYEADRRYWPKRLERIKTELQEEPERIKASYVVKARRIEPVGIVYLAPISG
ncbi:MAG: helicase [Myxococcales bacterium]|nr:helicase [Myxococcales bacterium]